MIFNIILRLFLVFYLIVKISSNMEIAKNKLFVSVSGVYYDSIPSQVKMYLDDYFSCHIIIK